jgi:glycosyltransferase involved in cell wall biosynthesis
MSNSLKVLHVIPSVSPKRGGPSKAIIDMVTALRQAGIQAEIATTNDHGDSLLDVPVECLMTHQGVPIRFFNRFSPPIPAIREYAYSYGFQKWLKANIQNYDVVHVHAIFSFCSTYTMALARKHGVAYVVRPIGQLEKWSLEQSKSLKRYYLNWIERTNLLNAKAVHFTAKSECSQALELLPHLRHHVIPLGLSIPMSLTQPRRKMRQRWSLDRGVPTILYLSRLHPKKGLDLLLDALAIVDDFPFKLLIAGEGDPVFKKALEDKIERLELQAHCQFIGFAKGSEKNLLLQGADLYALTSHSENFGIAVLEAMASGTAVLVSKQVALSEAVAQHKLGFVCDLEVNSIRRELIDALADIDNTEELGRSARDYVEQHYQWPNIAGHLVKLYKSVALGN